MSRRRKPYNKNGQPKAAPSSSASGSSTTPGTSSTPSGNSQGASVSSAPPTKPQRKWYKVDLHLHTPGSNDYEEPQASYFEWMSKVVEKELDVVAITDHNTVAGIAAIQREIEWLTRLERDGRLTDEERARLQGWRAFAEKVLVLPGFEFTATFGFHILGIFPPDMSVRQLEHILLTLKVPPDKLDIGSTETGAGTDVLTAYKVIREAGGVAIAAHANSTHGVAMRNFPFGGQTKIAYTQDINLDALEVTDLERRGHSTARFFNGSKSEYSRRMHCIQGSDAHRLKTDPKNPKRLGIGERPTELLLDAPTFDQIAALLRSNQYDRTRPARAADKPFDPLISAREEGPTIIQSFHESANKRSGKLTGILADVCAFANTDGGVIYVGAGPRNDKPKGLANVKQVEDEIQADLTERLTPPLAVKIDQFQSQGANILRLRVPKGDNRPYCLDGNKFYVRDETDTSLAVRDEIVALIQEVLIESGKLLPPRANQPGDNRNRSDGNRRQDRPRRPEQQESENGESKADVSEDVVIPPSAIDASDAFYLPQVGVEIVSSEERNGAHFHTIRDLRNGHLITNVTRKGARKLWNYAIQQHEDKRVRADKVEWRGNVGLVRSQARAGKVRYDLALREGEQIRVFYGVTDDGMEGAWAAFVQEE
ncbi:MAG: putative DNA binding domain-containing protein [Caldilineaceae bacterium]|nr:putative DNA binding domain-containing protein [Caldilineaceae bacterium]